MTDTKPKYIPGRPKVIMTKEASDATSELRRAVHASDLGLKRGEWPTHVRWNGRRLWTKAMQLWDASGEELVGCIYTRPRLIRFGGIDELRVMND